MAFGLKRINGRRQVLGGRALAQLFEGRRLHPGVADIKHQMKAFPQVVCPFDHHIQGLEAFRRHMPLRCNLCLTAIEVNPDKNPEFVVQTIPLFVHVLLAATLRPVGRDAATAPSLGRECDLGNSALHIRETARYLPLYWPAGVDRRARCTVLEAAMAPLRHLQLLQKIPGRRPGRALRNT